MTMTRLLTTAALALVMGAGAADAQTNQAAPERAPAAQQSAPPAKIAPPMNAGQQKPAMKPETTGQGAQRLSPGNNDSTNVNDAKPRPPERAGAAAPNAAPSTTGQGAAGARVNLTTEQRSKITTVIKRQKVAPVNLNISISVGTRVPDHVRYYPLPAEVVTIYPQWRGFDYILVGSTIVVIDPATREIVAVLEA